MPSDDETVNAVEVWCQQWEESERGWGQRPDGYSLHLTREDRDDYIAEHLRGLPKEVPDEYDRPVGGCYEVKVSAEKANAIRNSTNGIRLYDKPTPQPPVEMGGVWRDRTPHPKPEG